MPWTRKLHVVEPGRLLLEHADELGADPLALLLGVADAAQAREEPLLGVDRDQRHAEVVAERGDHLGALVLAHQAVVDEHARQPVADRAVDEQRGNTRVDPAGQPADRAPVADLGADRGRSALRSPSWRSRCGRSRRRPRGSWSAPAGRTGCARPRGGTGSRRRPRSVDSNAATGDAVDDASAVNPGGGENTVSRCDIQQVCSGGVPASSRPVSDTVSCERPNSPTSAPSTWPPSSRASSCMP